MPVSDGDLVHADRHGALVIPPDVIPELAGAIATLMNSERIIFDAVKGKRLTFEEFEDVWAAFEAART
jgi:regulator of RNase E activity RraA